VLFFGAATLTWYGGCSMGARHADGGWLGEAHDVDGYARKHRVGRGALLVGVVHGVAAIIGLEKLRERGPVLAQVSDRIAIAIGAWLLVQAL
jgi:hypothetical protein